MRSTITLAVALLAGTASGDVIISNLGGVDDLGTQFGPEPPSTTMYKAAGFTMGAQAFFLDSARIDLSAAVGSGPIDVSIWSDSGGAGPDTELTELKGLNLAGDGIYTFTSNSVFTLEANTTYWLHVDNAAETEFLWNATDGSPSGPHATSAGYHFNGAFSSFMNKLEINGTAVPSPATALAMGLAGLAATRRRR